MQIYVLHSVRLKSVGWVKPNIIKMVSMAGLSWIIASHFVVTHFILFSQNCRSLCSVLFRVRHFVPSLYAKSAEPLCALHRRIKALIITNKTDDNQSHRLFYGVVRVTIFTPFDKDIVAHENISDNVYQKLISVMKQSTQEYYNMRVILGLQAA